MGFIMVNGISYGTGEPVHVTRAEYDALPDSKLTDGQLYLVEDEDENPAANVVGLVDINEAINGVVLWENPNPSAEFPAQTVTLSDSIEKYEYVEAEYIIDGANVTSVKPVGTSGKIFKTDSLKWRSYVTYINDYIFIRDFMISDGLNVSMQNCYKRTQYGSFAVEVSNKYIIPVRIIGYPKADFNPIDGVLPPAQNVSYDNTASGLIAENVQDAVDEMVNLVCDLKVKREAFSGTTNSFGNYKIPDSSNKIPVSVDFRSAHIGYIFQYNGQIIVRVISDNASEIPQPNAEVRGFYYYISTDD